MYSNSIFYDAAGRLFPSKDFNQKKAFTHYIFMKATFTVKCVLFPWSHIFAAIL